MRRTLALCLVCLSYVVFGSVLWAAYHDFGKQSLLDRDQPAIAEGTPSEAAPRDRLPRDVSEAPGPPTASRAREASAARHDVSSSGAGQIPSLVDVDRSRTAPQRGGGAVAEMSESVATASDPATDALENATGEQPDQDVALPSEPLSAALVDAPVEQAGASPPKPVLKPLEAIPAAIDPGSGLDEPSQRLDVQRVAPPMPSLKPIVMPGNREPGRGNDTDQATAAAETLPDALRGWWRNLKILLASGPVLSGRPAGGDDSDRGALGMGSGATASSSSNNTSSSDGANNGASSSGGTTSGGVTDTGGGAGSSSGTGGGSPGGGSASGGGTAGRGDGDAGSTSGGGGGAAGAPGGGRDSGGGERGGQGGDGGGKGGGEGGGKGGDSGKGGGKGGGNGKGGGKGKG